MLTQRMRPILAWAGRYGRAVTTQEATVRRPALLVVDDEPPVLRAVQRDLRSRFGESYRVLRAGSGDEAQDTMRELRKRGEPLALVLADQRMPGMTGVELLEAARELFPKAKRALLTAYADTDAAIAAINRAQIDYYLQKPWDPPEERLFPTLEDLLGDWQADAVLADPEARLVGHPFSPASHEARDFLARNRVPYEWLDVERDQEARQLLALAGVSSERLPAVFLRDGSVLEAPTPLELAGRLGLATQAELDFYDLIIVGGGPAGLAAAVYGASEGLRTVLVERSAPGGQAGQSSRIENYLGFPNGLSGADLARRAHDQARRFGAELLTVQQVTGLEARGPQRVVTLAGGGELAGHSVLVATGVAYRRLDAPGVARLEGRGVYYGASIVEAEACKDKTVVIVGGANSAGQAAAYLSRQAGRVVVLVRGASLATSMSHYLIEQIAAIGNVEVRPGTRVVGADGDEHLERLRLRGPDGEEEIDAAAMFVFIGAAPYTDWVGDRVGRDAHGFVLAGADAAASDGHRWPLERDPFLLETTLPGVFVAGDVRHRSIKRVASAVGEGSMSVQFIHQYLADG
jgi:thioredoxin reductase (NADPH)